MTRYNKIRSMDVANGPGVRVSIYFQGCPFHCKGCFNENTWDFNGGIEFDDNVIDHLIELAGKDYIAGLSILGGEPLCEENYEDTLKLCIKFKEVYPDKDIWLWTGNLVEEINPVILNYIDVITDGRFIAERRDLRLKYAGSDNQRTLDAKALLKGEYKNIEN